MVMMWLLVVWAVIMGGFAYVSKKLGDNLGYQKFMLTGIGGGIMWIFAAFLYIISRRY